MNISFKVLLVVCASIGGSYALADQPQCTNIRNVCTVQSMRSCGSDCVPGKKCQTTYEIYRVVYVNGKAETASDIALNMCEEDAVILLNSDACR
jgi:hypothetical protein